LAFFIIDPENEYGHVGRMLGAEVVDVQPGKLMGLDPVQIFAESKDTAAAIIADIARIREDELYDELRNLVGVSDTIFDVFMNASQELKKRLRNLVDGADRFLVAGDPLPFTRRMVFNLQALHRAYQLSPERSVTLQVANVLIFSKIWQMIDNPQFIPLQDPKLVIVDEVWMYLTMPAAARFLEGVARRGRKRNVIFVVNTQRASDVLEGAGGRALAENCATKILMRQDESAIKNVGETFRLSSYEMDAVLEFEPGQAILVAEDVHIPVRFMATRDEYALFTTKPAERLI
ncbi:MAG: ATP-binding protein, partial [Candidatus Jordarchaeales archaeon]